MRFAKHTSGDVSRFVRIKRQGTKNCRIVSLDTGEEQLVPKTELVECSAAEAGVETETSHATPDDKPPAEDSADLSTESTPDVLSGKEVCRLMRNYQATIKDVAARLGIAEQQVRDARRDGLHEADQIEVWTAVIVGEEQPAATTAP